VVAFASLKTGMAESLTDKLQFFLILIIQLELFIFIASLIFTELPSDIKSKEFTKIILSRFFLFLVICFIAAFMIFIGTRFISAALNDIDTENLWENITRQEFGNWTKSTLKGLLVGAIIFVIIQWQDALKREQKLREENLIFQNETLKSQVNPHFLFNSLNTLSSLIKYDPETAESFTVRLASIYRYILDKSRGDKTLLEEELSFIGDYFYLHSVRDEGKIQLKISVPGQEKFYILPVSLQSLVENAIKHNIATRENPLIIEVFMEDDNIVVRNNLQKMATTHKTTGTGLKNLAERVRINTGKNIIIEEKKDFYMVKIPLIV
jgi:sensor histidine kinase YesM